MELYTSKDTKQTKIISIKLPFAIKYAFIRCSFFNHLKKNVLKIPILFTIRKNKEVYFEKINTRMKSFKSLASR